MNIPFVIDNIEVRLGNVLNHLLASHPAAEFDVATAYFSIRAFEQLRATLPGVGRCRLLLGDEPGVPADVGLRQDPASRRRRDAAGYLRDELNAEPLRPDTRRLVEDLVRFLRRDDVAVRLYLGHPPGEAGRRCFLHAKCYLVYQAGDGGPRRLASFTPVVGIVGSSNFTGPGLNTNRELNLVHKALLAPDEASDPYAEQIVARHAVRGPGTPADAGDPRLVKSEVGARALDDLARWFDAQWALAEDFKPQLIAILESSKFGGREYTPYEIYLKALYEYFRDDLDRRAGETATRSAVELTEFQEDAVQKARRILARYDGVIVADSVGLGKTWIGKKLLEDFAYHQRQKAVVICPAALAPMWEEELRSVTIAAGVLSQEKLGQAGFEPQGLADVDVIVVDEAHNFRNRLANRYRMLETILAAGGRRGRGGRRKKLILLTATPINNTIFDLYNQINLIAGNDRTYFAAAGIGDLYKYFLAARRDSVEAGGVRIFNLLEEVVIRRTRQFIRQAYPDATIGGRRITWPERRLRTVRYDLEATYESIYRQVVARIEALRLPHYNLEAYKIAGEKRDDFELGRQQALVGIFKSRFLKRLESSVDALRISIRRALEFAKTFDEYVQDGVVLDAASFHAAVRLLAPDDADDVGDADRLPRSRAAAIDAHAEAKAMIGALPRLDAAKYDRRRLHQDLTADLESLTEIWYAVRGIGEAEDAKLAELKRLLAGELRGRKVLVFSYYRDSARYLFRALTRETDVAWLTAIDRPHIRRIDSGSSPADRARIVEYFAPCAQGRPELAGGEREIDILIATDVLSEGQNLQDCGHLINYDLHWNPTRMVQRAGRIDRLGSAFEALTVFNMFPEAALEDLLGLVRRLTEKIDTINQSGFLDASVLGEVVTPRDFNTLKRIAAEDSTVIDEQESFLDLASGEAMQAELQRVLATETARWITDLDDGIHSGLRRPSARGVFFYFTAPHRDGGRAHFWRYYDLERRQLIDNRFQILQLIACAPSTPRFPPPYDEVDIYSLQRLVIDDILGDTEQRQAAALVAKPVAEEQVVAATILRQQLANPAYDRDELRALIGFLKAPLVGASVRTLRDALRSYSDDDDIRPLLQTVGELRERQGGAETDAADGHRLAVLDRDDLHLVCYEYICA